MEKGIASENISFGSGGALLQKFSRDTLDFAFKACYMQYIDGEELSSKIIQKNPLEFSIDGRLVISNKHSSYSYIDNRNLKLVFCNGELINPITFEQVRENTIKVQ